MADMGMTDFNNLSFPTILERLDLSSNRVTEERFLVQQPSDKIDFSGKIQELRQRGKIVDIIGPTKISTSMPICFSTFVGIKPKEYLKQYVNVAKILCKPPCKLQFVVWLEDTLTVLKNGWDTSMAQKAVGAYRAFFQKDFSDSQVLLSSEVAPIGIPQSFTEKLSAITTEEFLSVLPFHLRNPMFIKTLDIVHFTWNCYLLHQLPGVYLAGINNKRHFQLFRKVSGQQITAILLPLESENLVHSQTHSPFG
ncbi:MAG: hypothetical protein ABIH87_01135 [bacterium]|nr:hypothetical protein [Patescibacteria group bacterium]MBU1519777.1 hypothetical protein [Patescibacteria group bacterium]